MKLGKKFSAICFTLIASFSLGLCLPPVSAVAAAPAPMKAATPAKVYPTTTVTAKMLNVRSGPGKTFRKVATLKKGTKVRVIATKGTWKKVQVNKTTGYVSARYLK